MIYENITEKFLRYLKLNHTGEKKAVSSCYLENRFKISGRIVRKIVNYLRCEGNPVCSNKSGYYYAADEKELMRSISQLSNRIGNISKAKSGLLKAVSKFPDTSGQMKIEMKEKG